MGGSFEFSYTENFSVGDLSATTKKTLSSSISGPLLRGSVSYKPNRERNHDHQTRT